MCLCSYLYHLTYQLSPRLCHPCQRILWLIDLVFVWILELIEIDKILKRYEKCICFTSSQTNAFDGKENDGYHQKGENIYLTSSQTITTTDITPVTRPNMCNNWNEKLLDYISQQSVRPDSEIWGDTKIEREQLEWRSKEAVGRSPRASYPPQHHYPHQSSSVPLFPSWT